MNIYQKMLLVALATILVSGCSGDSIDSPGSASSFISPSSGNDQSLSNSSATITWSPPLTYTDGSALLPGEISQYRIYYSEDAINFEKFIDFDAQQNPFSYSIQFDLQANPLPVSTNLAIAMTTISSAGIESAMSELIFINTN